MIISILIVTNLSALKKRVIKYLKIHLTSHKINDVVFKLEQFDALVMIMLKLEFSVLDIAIIELFVY